MRTWTLLADAANARIYQSSKGVSDWTLLRELSHPQSRERAADMVSDKLGRVRQAATGARVSMEPPTPLKKKEAEKFAREVAAALERGLNDSAFERLVVVTAPAFLGVLRQLLAPRVAERIAQVVEKDYLHLDANELKERLREQLGEKK